MTQSKHLMLSLLVSSMISVIFLHHFFAKYLVLLDQMIMWLLLISLCFSVMSVFLDPFSPSVSILRTSVMGWSAGERLLPELVPHSIGPLIKHWYWSFPKKNQFVENYTSWYWKAELSNSLYSFNLGIVCVSHTQVVVLLVFHPWFHNYVYAIGIYVSSSGGIQT